MRYIRTKDGRIIDLIAYKKIGEINGAIKFISKLNGGFMFIQKQDILRQVNTIEELCDEFVSIFKDNDKFVETDFQMAQDRFTGLKGIRKPTACYGAIWTDKGLIYVAEMNDKGELELL